MRKKRINLIYNQNYFLKYQILIYYIKLILVAISCLFFILVIVSLIKLSVQLKTYNNLILKKNDLINLLNKKSNEEIKLQFLIKKYQLLTDYLNEDARFLHYYQLLTDNLSHASEEVKLKTFNINKNKKVEFTISFRNFLDLKNFFQFTESPTFLNNFIRLSLKNFNVVNEKNDSNIVYELSFSGQFKNIKN